MSHAVLGGPPNHGVWAVPLAGLSDNSEFAGHGRFLTLLNRPKNAAGDEVAGPVKWMTVRSGANDKFAQPDGLWIGKRGVATGVTAAGPELKGATNVVLPHIDHRETSFGPGAFAATYRFVAGTAPATVDVVPESGVMLAGRVDGLGLSPTDPASGNFASNLALSGARLEVHAVDPDTGERRGGPVHSQVVAADGRFGPFATDRDARLEFVVSAPGYATPGAGVSSSRIKPTGLPRAVVAEFNGEKVVGRSWPLSENRVTVLELTY